MYALPAAIITSPARFRSDPELRVRGEQSIAPQFQPASRWTMNKLIETRVTVNGIQKFTGYFIVFSLH
jgi:hypothetical protein